MFEQAIQDALKAWLKDELERVTEQSKAVLEARLKEHFAKFMINISSKLEFETLDNVMTVRMRIPQREIVSDDDHTRIGGYRHPPIGAGGTS